jgi:hypothetical protein
LICRQYSAQHRYLTSSPFVVWWQSRLGQDPQVSALQAKVKELEEQAAAAMATAMADDEAKKNAKNVVKVREGGREGNA